MLVWAEYMHMYRYIYTRILKSVCLSVDVSKRQVAILAQSSSGDVSNYAYRLTVHPVTSSRLSSAYHFVIREKHSKTIAKTDPRACGC